LQIKLRCWRAKRDSAKTAMLRGDAPGASTAASAKFDNARTEARTICEGLLDGQRFDRMAGKTDADWSRGRNDGPPKSLLEIVFCCRPRLPTCRNACYYIEALEAYQLLFAQRL